MPETTANTGAMILLDGREPANQHEPGGTFHRDKPDTNPAQRAILPVHRFRFRGREWKLTKRAPAADASWYLHADYAGTRIRQTLRSSSVTHAEAAARAYLEKFLAGTLPQPAASVPRSTFGDLVAVVQSLDMDAQPVARVAYLRGARNLFAFALGCELEEVDGKPLAELISPDLAARFWSAVMQHANGLQPQEAQNAFKRRARAWFNVTNALLAKDSVRSMPTLGVVPPSPAIVAEFRASKPSRFRVGAAPAFIAPAPDLIRRMWVEWVRLARDPQIAIVGAHGDTSGEPVPLTDLERRNMFCAVGLMLSCGLRKGEVAQIQWRHLSRDPHGLPRLFAPDIKVKRRTGGGVSVRPLDPFWSILNRTIDRHGWRGAPTDYVLASATKTHQNRGALEWEEGGDSDRIYWPFWNIGKWLRAMGWELQKTNHSLRDLAASLVTMKFDLMRAKLFCQHRNLKTTESHYSRFVREEVLDDSRALAWLRWAK